MLPRLTRKYNIKMCIKETEHGGTAPALVTDQKQVLVNLS
jgi:hypothetical protein